MDCLLMKHTKSFNPPIWRGESGMDKFSIKKTIRVKV